MSHWYDSTPKKSRRKRDSNLGSSALEADALTTRPTRRSTGTEDVTHIQGQRMSHTYRDRGCHTDTRTKDVTLIHRQRMSHRHRDEDCYTDTGAKDVTHIRGQRMSHRHRDKRCNKDTGTKDVTHIQEQRMLHTYMERGCHTDTGWDKGCNTDTRTKDTTHKHKVLHTIHMDKGCSTDTQRMLITQYKQTQTNSRDSKAGGEPTSQASDPKQYIKYCLLSSSGHPLIHFFPSALIYAYIAEHLING